MRKFQFNVTLTLEAGSEFAAKEKIPFVMSNLKEMCSHAPYPVSLEVDESSCEEIELDEEYD